MRFDLQENTLSRRKEKSLKWPQLSPMIPLSNRILGSWQKLMTVKFVREEKVVISKSTSFQSTRYITTMIRTDHSVWLLTVQMLSLWLYFTLWMLALKLNTLKTPNTAWSVTISATGPRTNNSSGLRNLRKITMIWSSTIDLATQKTSTKSTRVCVFQSIRWQKRSTCPIYSLPKSPKPTFRPSSRATNIIRWSTMTIFCRSRLAQTGWFSTLTLIRSKKLMQLRT